MSQIHQVSVGFAAISGKVQMLKGHGQSTRVELMSEMFDIGAWTVLQRQRRFEDRLGDTSVCLKPLDRTRHMLANNTLGSDMSQEIL